MQWPFQNGSKLIVFFIEHLVVNQLFGTVSGLGMGFITFDWAQISWIGSPLMIPWWAQIHIFAGFVLFYWLILPILYYTNVCTTTQTPENDSDPGLDMVLGTYANGWTSIIRSFWESIQHQRHL